MDQTQDTSSTSTCKCRQTDGAEARTFWDDWREAVPAGPRLIQAFKTAIDGLKLSDIEWEVRVIYNSEDEEWRKLDAVTECQYGSFAYFIMNGACGELVTNQGLYQAQTIVHEVLHVHHNPMERLIERAFPENSLMIEVLDNGLHTLLDSLAWLWVPYLFPTLDPKENLINVQETSSNGPSGPSMPDIRSDLRFSSGG